MRTILAYSTMLMVLPVPPVAIIVDGTRGIARRRGTPPDHPHHVPVAD